MKKLYLCLDLTEICHQRSKWLDPKINPKIIKKHYVNFWKYFSYLYVFFCERPDDLNAKNTYDKKGTNKVWDFHDVFYESIKFHDLKIFANIYHILNAFHQYVSIHALPA